MNIKTRSRFLLLLNIGLGLMLLIGCSVPVAKPAEEVDEASIWNQFEAELESLRQEMKIPGLSAAVVMDQKLVWARGFGYADVENRIEVTPGTPFHLASVTKTVAAVLMMQLVQEGVISLDDPISRYGIELESDGVILVRHLLMHASTHVPGTTYAYDGDRYAYLSQVAERATGKTFGALVQERILDPLGMTNTWMQYTPCAIELGRSPYPIDFDFSKVEIARPYQLDSSFEVIPGINKNRGFTAAAGLISTAVDLAKFDIALDQNVLLNQGTKENMLAPAISIYPDQPDLAHGLGWFSQDFMDVRLNWHLGCGPPTISAIIIKAPEQNLTFIILANTDLLCVQVPHGDISYQTMVLAFYETFIYPRLSGKTVPQVNWEADESDLADQLSKVKDPDLRKILERELWAYRQLFFSVGKTDLAGRLRSVHQRVFPEYSPTWLDLYTYHSPPNVVSPDSSTDLVQLTAAQLERLTGTYLLPSNQINRLSLPPEVDLQEVNGKLIVSYKGGCFDLVSITPTLFTTAERLFTLSVQMDGDEVKRVKVLAEGAETVYLPKK